MSNGTIGVQCVDARNVLRFHLPRPLTTLVPGAPVATKPLQGKATVWVVQPIWPVLTTDGRQMVPPLMRLSLVQELRSNDPLTFSLTLPRAADTVVSDMWGQILPQVIRIIQDTQGQCPVVALGAYDNRVQSWHLSLVGRVANLARH